MVLKVERRLWNVNPPQALTSSPAGRLWRNMKYTAVREGERWLGGRALLGSGLSEERETLPKDLERHPLSVRIQGREDYENTTISVQCRFQYKKDPLTKSLEPNYLSPQTPDCNTVSGGRGVG